jgi:hypothetical protein
MMPAVRFSISVRPKVASSTLVSMSELFELPVCAFFDVGLMGGGTAPPTRLSMPPCLRPSRTLRAADAVARRQALLDGRCARRPGRCAVRGGRMVPIEQKDRTTGALTAGGGRLPATASGSGSDERRSVEMIVRSWAASASGKTIALVGFCDAAGCGQSGQSLVETGGANPAQATQFGERQRVAGTGERCCDRSSTEFGGGVWGWRRSITSSASALARWASSSVTAGMAGAARCSR